MCGGERVAGVGETGGGLQGNFFLVARVTAERNRETVPPCCVRRISPLRFALPEGWFVTPASNADVPLRCPPPPPVFSSFQNVKKKNGTQKNCFFVWVHSLRHALNTIRTKREKRQFLFRFMRGSKCDVISYVVARSRYGWGWVGRWRSPWRKNRRTGWYHGGY